MQFHLLSTGPCHIRQAVGHRDGVRREEDVRGRTRKIPSDSSLGWPRALLNVEC